MPHARLREAELQQKTHLDVIHLDDLEAAAMSRAQIISGKAKSRLAERRYVHKDGSTVWAQVAGAVVRDAVRRAAVHGALSPTT